VGKLGKVILVDSGVILMQFFWGNHFNKKNTWKRTRL